MFRCLKVENPGAYWQARRQMGKWAYRLNPKAREKLLLRAKYIRFYNRRNDSFGTGLLPRVTGYLDRKGIHYKIVDKRQPARCNTKPPSAFHFKASVEHRPEQVRAVQAALKDKRGILACATNTGKTLIAGAIIKEHPADCRAIYIVHRIGLAQQTGKMLGNLLPNKITVLGAGNKRFLGKGICVTTVQTAVHLLEEEPAFRQFLQSVDLMFVDEIHTNSAAQVCKVSDACSAPMRFGLSGTVDENNKRKMLNYQSITGPVIARISNRDLISSGRSARPQIQFREVHSEAIPKAEGFHSAYLKGIVHCTERNRLICKSALRHAAKELPVMISVSRIEHGTLLRDLLQKGTELRIDFLQGNTPLSVREKVLLRFVQGKVPILILSPIGDVGLDLPGGIGAWINAAGSKGYEIVLQRLGRALRKNKYGNRVKVVDFVDLHNPYLMEHSLARIQHFQREGLEVEFRD